MVASLNNDAVVEAFGLYQVLDLSTEALSGVQSVDLGSISCPTPQEPESHSAVCWRSLEGCYRQYKTRPDQQLYKYWSAGMGSRALSSFCFNCGESCIGFKVKFLPLPQAGDIFFHTVVPRGKVAHQLFFLRFL